MRYNYEPQRTEPRRRGFHLDHGSSGIILAERRRNGAVVTTLVWFAGYQAPVCGVRGFGRQYQPAQMIILDPAGYYAASLFKGGRVSRARLEECSAVIDDHLGEDATARLKTNQTLVIEDDVCESSRSNNQPAADEKHMMDGIDA